MLATTDYGALKDVVATAGAITAAGAAIALSFKGRANWEPSEEDIPRGAQRVGALIADVAIVLMWVEWRDGQHNGSLDTTIIVATISTLLSLLAYGYLVGVQTFDKVEVNGEKRIIGGFWLTKRARKAKRENDVSTQDLFAGSAYDVDKLWSRPSRQLAKTAFVLGYIGLTASGTVALAAAAIRLGVAVG